MSTPIPDEKTRRTQIALITAISVVAVAILGMVGWAALRHKPASPRQTDFTRAVDASMTTSAPVPSAEASGATSSVTASVSAAPGPAPGAGVPANAATIKRAKRIAYRLNSAIYVAAEDGSGARSVAPSPQAPFALSPDGTLIATVNGGQLMIYGVDNSHLTVVGVAETATPVWMPDSSGVLFVRTVGGSARVVRVPRAGGKATQLSEGSGVAVSPDGTVIAVLPPEGSTGRPVRISRGGGAFVDVALQGGDPIAVALSNDRLYVSTLSAAGESAVWSVALDGSASRKLVGPGSGADKAATFGRLLPSPSGTSLLYTTESDDGYSRMWLVPTAGGAPSALTPRRDSYPLGWTVDGSAILFIEGNAIQGEDTALYRIAPDGSGRRVVVSGATL